ncbi:MAG TPA: HNH endonuclease signature motif containing protein [Anaerolineae bacterium]|nr:HNH endonuclease signature motif containing protein [Anaerolineae bacterium]
MALRKVSGVREETAQLELQHKKAPGHRFAIGTAKPPPTTYPWLSEKEYREANRVQSSKAISVGTIEGGRYEGKTLWWCKDEFYVDKRLAVGGEREEGITGLQECGYALFARGWRGLFEVRGQFEVYIGGVGHSTYPSLSAAEYGNAKRVRWSRPVSVGMIDIGFQKGRVVWVYGEKLYMEKRYTWLETREGGTTGLTKVTGVHEDIKNLMPIYGEHYRFAIDTTGRLPATSPWRSENEYREAKKLQSSKPVALGTIEGSPQEGKTLWWYQDEFYAENDGYTSDEVQLLLSDRARRRKRKFERLQKEMLSEPAIEEARRERIPENVRIFVWKRDDGRCVECGSQENLEFDHIIPLAKGGSNTARNIQLLCETCNRRKSATI